MADLFVFPGIINKEFRTSSTSIELYSILKYIYKPYMRALYKQGVGVRWYKVLTPALCCFPAPSCLIDVILVSNKLNLTVHN